MKVVFRIDDVGYSDISNLGAFKAIDEGVASMVELMPDTPGAIKAMEFLRQRPWISVNWHSHFWGSPVAGAENVPSLVGENGRFVTDPNTHRSITDGWKLDELIRECRAQILRFIKVLGRAPDATDVGDPDSSVIAKTKKIVCDEFGIEYNYSNYYHYGPGKIPGHMPGENISPFFNHEKWGDRKIFEYENFGRPGLLLKDFRLYDPLEMVMTMPESDRIWVRSSHPGFVCSLVWDDTWDNCSITRCKDVEMLCSERLRNWLIENRVEVINLHDALYGTRDYQNHLLASGSPLAIENMEGQICH